MKEEEEEVEWNGTMGKCGGHNNIMWSLVVIGSGGRSLQFPNLD